MRVALTFAASLIATSAFAKDVTVTLNDGDQNIVLQALDTYVKAGGLNVAPSVVALLQKLQVAASAPQPVASAAPPISLQETK